MLVEGAKCLMHHECIPKTISTRHRIQSGVWNGPLLGYHQGQGYTIRRAIGHWYENISDTEEEVAFRDACSGLHCSRTCPEQILLESNSQKDAWSVGVRIGVAAAVLLIAVSSLVMKVNVHPLYTYIHIYHLCMCMAFTINMHGQK